jgi:hypothetical protein
MNLGSRRRLATGVRIFQQGQRKGVTPTLSRKVVA